MRRNKSLTELPLLITPLFNFLFKELYSNKTGTTYAPTGP